MRNPKRIKRILKKLEELWAENPDQRLGQLLINYGLGQSFYEEDDLTEYKLCEPRIAVVKRGK